MPVFFLDFSFNRSEIEGTNQEVWALNPPKRATDISPDSDAALYYSGHIVVVPMLADEHDYDAIQSLKNEISLLPGWNYKN